MDEVTIYHNPQCGTSRITLGHIRDAGIEPVIIDYVQQPPTRERLKELVAAKGGHLCRPSQAVLDLLP